MRLSQRAGSETATRYHLGACLGPNKVHWLLVAWAPRKKNDLRQFRIIHSSPPPPSDQLPYMPILQSQPRSDCRRLFSSIHPTSLLVPATMESGNSPRTLPTPNPLDTERSPVTGLGAYRQDTAQTCLVLFCFECEFWFRFSGLLCSFTAERG